MFWVCMAFLLHRDVGIFPRTFKMLDTQTLRSHHEASFLMHLGTDNTNKLHHKHAGSSLIFQTVFCILMMRKQRKKKTEQRVKQGEQWWCARYIFHLK